MSKHSDFMFCDDVEAVLEIVLRIALEKGVLQSMLSPVLFTTTRLQMCPVIIILKLYTGQSMGFKE